MNTTTLTWGRVNVIAILIYDIAVIAQCVQIQKIIPELSICGFVTLFSCVFISNVMCIAFLIKRKFTYFAIELIFVVLSMSLLSLPIQHVVDSLSRQ